MQPEISETDLESSAENPSQSAEASGRDLPITRRHILILAAVVVVALAAWKLRETGGDEDEDEESADSDAKSDRAQDEIAEIRDGELSPEVTISDEDGEDIEIPTNTEQTLEADEAVVEMLKERGHMEASE